MSAVKHSLLPLCAVRDLLFSLLVTENMFLFTNFTNPTTNIPAAILSLPGGLTVHSAVCLTEWEASVGECLSVGRNIVSSCLTAEG